MERITERFGKKTFLSHEACSLCGYEAAKKSTFCENIGCQSAKDRTCPYLVIIDRLADYEDTGLTPEKIEALIAELDMFKAEASERSGEDNNVPATWNTKSVELCERCYYGYYNTGCSHAANCGECEQHKDGDCECRCNVIENDEPCPWFKEAISDAQIRE